MRTLAIDIETFSPVDLISCGVYKYAEDPDFDILMVAFSWDGGPEVEIIEPDDASTVFLAALTDRSVIKTAFNANFERTCLARYYGLNLRPDQWQCTAVHASTLGLPRRLEDVARVLGLPEDKRKMTEGKALIQYFSKPCRPTKANGGRTRNLPHHAPDKWETFRQYCVRDVEAEQAVRKALMTYPVPPEEWRLYQLDLEINDRGVKVDRQLVTNAISASEHHKARLEVEAIKLTGLDNPNSVQQLKAWLEDVDGVRVSSLNKATVPQLIKDTDSETVERVLRIRQEMGKTSVGKYLAMARSACSDDRVRGALMFYGSRTGRWAGRIVQVQNLPQNKLEDLALARELLADNDTESIEMLFGNLPDTLSQLIRTAFIPETGRFIVCDFSAIEARVIAWLAGESWRMDVFNTHGKIYEASASQMFRVPLETIAKGRENYPLRQKGKIAELALGYGGSVGALTAMGALKMGLTDRELPDLVEMWRKANPAITRLWWDVDSAAAKAVRGGSVTQTHGLRFDCRDARWLFVELPSGRRLAYFKPQAKKINMYGRDRYELTYEGTEQGSKAWGRIDTYGPKLVENCLAGDTKVLTERGWLALQDLHITDKVWDGVDYVKHQGLVKRGTQHIIDVDGVRMTPDHKVLTDGGWRDASSCKGYNRKTPRLPNGHRVPWVERAEVSLGHPLRVWQGRRLAGEAFPVQPVMRLQKEGADRRQDPTTRQERAPGVCCLAVNAGSVPTPVASCVGALWRARYYGLRALAGLRGILGGHGPDLRDRADDREGGQQQGVRSGKLHLGFPERASTQHPGKPKDRRQNAGPDRRRVRAEQDDRILPVRSRGKRISIDRSGGRSEPVYDIMNCGPRHRFVVLGKAGPLIVHNCVQAIARDCLAEAMLRVDASGHDIIMHVHDEMIIEAAPGATLEDIQAAMAIRPTWGPDLPLRGDGYECPWYRKE